MSYNPELAAALAASPAFTQEPPPPPPGISAWEFSRQLSKRLGTPISDYYKERLPDCEALSMYVVSQD